MSWAVRDSRSLRTMFEYVFGGVIALALLIYLVYALLHPDRF